MKPSNEEKARFFAQYWRQKVMRCDILNGVVGSRVSGLMNVSMYAADIPEYFLELKPLSSISEEDAIEVAKIYFAGHSGTIDGKWPEYVINDIKRSAEFKANKDLKIADYLRSKGYALPWNGHTVEQMIEWGWIKLKT